nr:hypothetical protein CFP56_37150 [Quercus suber]
MGVYGRVVRWRRTSCGMCWDFPRWPKLFRFRQENERSGELSGILRVIDFRVRSHWLSWTTGVLFEYINSETSILRMIFYDLYSYGARCFDLPPNLRIQLESNGSYVERTEYFG